MTEAHCQIIVIGLALLLIVSSTSAAPPGQMLKRQVHAELPLAQATIVAPADAAWRKVADDLAAAIKETTGAVVPVVEDGVVVAADGRTVRDEYRRRHLILVGHALNNRAIFPLYCRWLDAADGAYPGGDGYELRTVVDPYGTDCNELIVGATTPAGAVAGVQALKSKLQGKDGVLPHLLEVRVGPKLQGAFSQAIAEVKANPVHQIGPVLTNGDLANFANDALKYAWTGERAFAERAARVLCEMNRRFDGSYYHGDVRTCDDYALEYAVRGWLVLQHAGVLSDDELWETDRNFYHDFPYSAHGAGNVGSRHLASGSMAFFLALDGLLTYGNPDAEARRQLDSWREGVRAYFHGACHTYRGDVDQAQDYGALENVFKYATHDGYWDYFTSQWADRTITQMLMNVDNAGWYSGVGGYGEAMPGSLNYPVAIGVCLPITAFVERRGDLRWIKEHVPNLGGSHLGFQVLGVHAFDMGEEVPATEPQGELTGLTLLPLSEYHWQLGQTPVTDGVGPVTTPLEQCVDKVMLREGFAPTDQYLLLNGFQNTVMGCLDGNAIVRFCDGGEVCLFQSTMEEGHDTKNAVWVSNGRNDEPLEGCVERGPMADLGEVCFSSTTLPRYHGTSWERNLFWRRGGVLVVMDRLTIEQPGKYVMACTWRSPRYARLTEEGAWEARSEKGAFTINGAAAGDHDVIEGQDGETSVELGEGHRLTSALGHDRFSAEPPWVLRDTRRVTGQAGQVVDFANVLWWRPTGEGQECRLTRLSDAAVAIRGPETAVLTRGPQRLRDHLDVDAEFAWLGATDWYVHGVTRLAVGDAGLRSDSPIDVSLKVDGGVRGTIIAPTSTKLTLRLPGLGSVRLDGADVAGNGGTVTLQMAPGKHALECAGGAELSGVIQRLISEVKAPPQSAPRSPSHRGPAGAPDPLRSVWTCDGLRSAGRRERDVTIHSRCSGAEWQPGPSSLMGDSFFHHSISPLTVSTWKADEVELRIDLPRRQTITGLRFHTYYGPTDLDKVKPDPCTVVAALGEGKTERALARPLTRRYQYLRGSYGSSYFSEVVDEVTGLHEPAKTLHVRLLKATGGDVRLGRIEILTDGPGDTTPLKAQPIRWTTDGPDSWAVWNPDRGHLSIIDDAGKLTWEHDFSAAITGLCCGDVNGDGVNELVITAADGKVRRLDRAGQERIIKDWRGVYEATGGKYYYGPVPHGVGIYDTPGQSEKELAVGHYYFLTGLKLDGTIGHTYEGTACYWQDFMDSGLDLNGDGVTELLVYSETPWQTRVPVVAIDSRTHEPLSSFPAGNGGARLFEMLRIGDENCVAVGSHKGCGIYSLTKSAYKWYLAGEVFKSSFFMTDLERDGKPEMLTGQRDGFLLAVDLDGKIVRQIEVGEEIGAVGALEMSKGLLLLASTAKGTRCYDAAGNPVGQSPVVAQRFVPTTHAGAPALLALHVDGRVELLAAAP